MCIIECMLLCHLSLSGKVSPGRVSHHLGSMMDWYSTALDLAGIKQPDDRIIDGMSLLPLLINGTETDRYVCIHVH